VPIIVEHLQDGEEFKEFPEQNSAGVERQRMFFAGKMQSMSQKNSTSSVQSYIDSESDSSNERKRKKQQEDEG